MNHFIIKFKFFFKRIQPHLQQVHSYLRHLRIGRSLDSYAFFFPNPCRQRNGRRLGVARETGLIFDLPRLVKYNLFPLIS